MAIAPYLREIDRSAKGARSLGVDAARDLMGQLPDGQLTELEIGAFAMAMRMRGESLDELIGFRQRCTNGCCRGRATAR